MTSEPRYERNALTSVTEFPLDYNPISGTFSTGSLGNLQASDDVYMVFDSALVGSNQELEVEFIGSHVGHMPFLQIKCESKASIAVSNHEVRVYNYSTGAYETVGAMQISYGLLTSDQVKYLYSLLNNTNYRASDGTWKIKVKAWTTGSPAQAFTVYFDYIHYYTAAYQLGTTRTLTATGNDLFVDGITIGVRVWQVNSNDTETEITRGVPVATVTGPSSTTNLNNTWPCPETANVVAVIMRIYRGSDPMESGDIGAGGLPFVFITEDLNTTLSSATWTVYYYFRYFSIPNETYFEFGSITRDSRIENFSYGVAAAEPSEDGLSWTH